MTTAVDATPKITGPSWSFSHGALRVSDDKRSLVHEDGTAFIWLGGTAWELFHRLTLEEAGTYLENRRAKGYTVVQAVALAECDGVTEPTPDGLLPFVDADPSRPVEEYWQHVDAVVRLAEGKGIYVGMLPTWGRYWADSQVRIFTEESAYAYGRFIGGRYAASPNIIWILGGDRRPVSRVHFELVRQMARGVRAGDTGHHLVTYHPRGGSSSSQYHHAEDWLDFNMMQTGHGEKDAACYDLISLDYNLLPMKPTLDGEPRYENHPARGLGWKKGIDVVPEEQWFDAYDVRQAAYWDLFAGAFGHTYGCHDIWQMLTPAHTPRGKARGTWQESLDLPGAQQMLYVRNLVVSRPMLGRVPCPDLVAGDAGKGADHKEATLGPDGSYAFVYLPSGGAVDVDCSLLSGEAVRACWYDPRTGLATRVESPFARSTHTFTAPGEHERGNDWVLVLDDTAREFVAPGSVSHPT